MSDTVTVDRRVRRTRKLLQEALLTLAEKRDLGSITVQEVADQADVNRATIYQHYRDLDDLVDQTFSALLADLIQECGPVLSGVTPLHPEVIPPGTVEMLEAIARRASLFRKLFARDGSSTFSDRFQAYNERLFLEAWSHLTIGSGSDGPPPELRARFATSAFVGVVGWWLDEGLKQTPDDIAAWLWRLSRAAWFESAGPEKSTDI